MQPRSPSPDERGSTALVAVAGVCLAVAIVVPLLVGTYARTDPELFGFPFFFWYQFALIPVASALVFIAFLLLNKTEPARRAKHYARQAERRRNV
jgi:uncharacterized membrane protein